MGSESPLKLPVIDFSNPDLKPGTPEWESLKAEVRQALGEFGCFVALFDKVPLELRKSLLGAMEELFDIPLQTKLLNVTEKPFHGYVGQHPLAPLFETMGIEDANISEKVESQTNVFWPEGNPSFCTIVQSYAEQLSKLDPIIRRMVLDSLGLEKYLDEHMGSTHYVLKFMKYHGPRMTETKVALDAHTDKNAVTILYQDQIGGLEVKTKDDEWINVKPSPDSFIVMIGECLQAITNGRLHAPYHRVMMTGDKARYSAGLFVVPQLSCNIKAHDELVDEEHPLLFKPFNYGEFLDSYHRGWFKTESAVE